MRIGKNIAAAFAAVALAALVASGCAKKPPEQSKDLEFKATLMIEDGGGKIEHTVYFDGDKQRVEMVSPGSGVFILREDKGVIWTLMPAMKIFLEGPLSAEHKNPLFFKPDEIKDYEIVGEETVDGHPAVKERLKMHNAGGAEIDIYRWFATDIKWPVRAEEAGGAWKLYFRDIRLKRNDPALFEIPEGYRKIAKRTMHVRGRD